MYKTIEEIEKKYKLSSLKISDCDKQLIIDIFNGIFNDVCRYEELQEKYGDIEIYKILGLYY